MKNRRRFAAAGTVVLTVAVVLGVAQYLTALPDKPAGSAATAKPWIPNELALDERQDAYTGGQTYMAIMNSELTDTYTGVGWRGSGRSMSPTMGYPSFTVPAGGFDAALWASAFGITAYQPDAVFGMPANRAEGAFIGTSNVYRIPPHQREQAPQGFWSDQGGPASPGFGGGTVGPGGYREPFITETTFNTNTGIRVMRQSYSFSYGYGHTNDFILLRHVLKVHGDVDVDQDQDGILEEVGVPIRNFFVTFNYDFDIPWTNNPLLVGGTTSGGTGGDDRQPPGMFFREMPPPGSEALIHSGRFDQPPYGPRFYSGLVTMFDEEYPGHSGMDSYVWNTTNGNFNPLHVGEASIMVLEGDGTGPVGDLNAVAALDIFEAPSVGLFNLHEWWVADIIGVFDWYRGSATKYLDDIVINEPGGSSRPHTDLFISGTPLERDTDISTWVAKTQRNQEAEGTGLLWGDPRNLTQPGNPGKAAVGLREGQYDHITLFDLDGVFAGIVPDPNEGSDSKEESSITGCIRNALGWGPYTREPGEDMTIWHVDLVGAGLDGAYDVYLRAQDVWMQRKYNPANNTYYWDGSNDRTIPMYNADGSVVRDGNGDVMTVTHKFGRGADSGALFHPAPPPTLSVFPTTDGTIALAWTDNAETAIDPGRGTADFAKYRVYRASGFVDQFPTSTTVREFGYNSTVIPPNLGLSDDASPITDVTDPTAGTIKQGHPYARFIHEGLTLGADYNIGGVYDLVADDLVNRFASPNFSGPYVQIAEFGGGGDQTNSLAPPASVTYPNPYPAGLRLPGFEDDNIETRPSSSQIVETNNRLGATTAFAMDFTDRYPDTIGSGESQITSVGGITSDPRLIGKSGYIFEDRSVLIGFSYWYYVAAVDNESAVQKDFDNYILDQNSSQQVIERTINGLESFYTMNANGTDGRWHGQFPYRGLNVGPQVPGQEVFPYLIARRVQLSDLSHREGEVTVAPNPFVPRAGGSAASQARSVRFHNVPARSRITIFDAAGLRVREIDASDAVITDGGVDWDLTTKSGDVVSSGLYICAIETEIAGENRVKTLKLYIRH